MSGKRLSIPIGVLLVFVATSIYWDAFDNEFVWDDAIVFKKQLPNFIGFKQLFFPPQDLPRLGERYYRPLISLSYQIDERIVRSLWPAREWEEGRRLVYHVSPVVYHGFATFLVFLFGLSLTRAARWGDESGRLLAATLSAGLFALHPIHVESVAWMVGRSDVICGLFYLPCLIAYIEFRTREGSSFRPLLAAVALLTAFGAMLCKETGVGLIFAVPAIDLLLLKGRPDEAREADRPGRAKRGRKGRREREQAARRALRRQVIEVASSWVALAAVALCYFALRSSALGEIGAPHPGKSPMFRASFGSLGWYVWKALWPPPQSGFVASIPGTLYAVFGLVTVCALVPLAVRRVVHPGHSVLSAELTCAFLFLSALAPSMAPAVQRISETPLAERYLYIPTASSCLLIALLLVAAAERVLGGCSRATRMAVSSGVCLLIVIPAALSTTRRIQVWESDYTFWRDTSEKLPGEGLPHLQLGLALAKREGVPVARVEEQYRLALETYDDAEGRSKAWNNLATLEMEAGNWAEAIEFLNNALREMPNYANAYFNRAMCKLSLSTERRGPERIAMIHDCLSDLSIAIELDPYYTKALYQYGRVLSSLGRREEARPHLLMVTKIAPGSDVARLARRLLGQ